MEKILNDRLNTLKSELASKTNPKLSKQGNQSVIDAIRLRINEVEWLIYRINKYNNHEE